ncbi:MAG: 50S ribosomal protein L29 [Microgenomates group bacterium]|jgi:ribosomal protein L29
MKEVSQKTAEELKKDIAALKLEIAKLNVEMSVAPQKNTNSIPNKKKQLAVLLTALQQKK